MLRNICSQVDCSPELTSKTMMEGITWYATVLDCEFRAANSFLHIVRIIHMYNMYIYRITMPYVIHVIRITYSIIRYKNGIIYNILCLIMYQLWYAVG